MGQLDRTQPKEHSRHKSQEGLQTHHVQEELKMGRHQCPSAPAPSFLYPASNLDWRFISLAWIQVGEVPLASR